MKHDNKLDEWQLAKVLSDKGHNITKNELQKDFNELKEEDIEWYNVGRIGAEEGYFFCMDCELWHKSE